MKKFLVTINAYDYYAKFEVLSEDNPVSLEQAIVDKLGVNNKKLHRWKNPIHTTGSLALYLKLLYKNHTIHLQKHRRV